MTHEWRKSWLIVLVVAAASLWTSAASNAMEYSDILGTWCSASAKIRFTRDSMKVTLFSSGRILVYKVTRYDLERRYVRVHWVNLKKEEVWAEYSEFSPDGQEMVLQPNKVAPRRPYHRC